MICTKMIENSPALFVVFLVMAGCGQSGAPAVRPQDVVTQNKPPNFLILIGDDMGVETLSSYGIGEVTAVTPNLDRLAANGLQFQRFWAQPACSPTRATMLTGRYGFRTGVLIPSYPREDLFKARVPPATGHEPKELIFTPRGHFEAGRLPPPPPSIDLSKPATDGLPPHEVTLPQLLKALPAEYATAAVGKWHLADSSNGWLSAPNQAGFDYFAGFLLGVTNSFFRFHWVEQGVESGRRGYIDELIVKRGTDWLRARTGTDDPWLLWVAFINPHSPFTLPPKRLLNSEASLSLDEEGLTPENTRPYAMAMIEAMDTLIGQVLESVPEQELENTYVIFVGDNGSVKWAQPSPPVSADRSKMTIYEGGIRVPFIVSGPAIPAGSRTNALANSVDVFATVLELAGGDLATDLPTDRPLDSRSLASVFEDPESSGPREWAYSDSVDVFSGAPEYAIHDGRHKYIVNRDGEELYDLRSDPWERNNLLAGTMSAVEQTARARLSSIVRELRAREED